MIICLSLINMLGLEILTSHEKNMYERFRMSKVNIQSLIVPKKLSLSPQQANSISVFKEELKTRGFELKFMTGSWYLTGLPQIRNIFLSEYGILD